MFENFFFVIDDLNNLARALVPSNFSGLSNIREQGYIWLAPSLTHY
jgi:hypothetical protein